MPLKMVPSASFVIHSVSDKNVSYSQRGLTRFTMFKTHATEFHGFASKISAENPETYLHTKHSRNTYIYIYIYIYSIYTVYLYLSLSIYIYNIYSFEINTRQMRVKISCGG